MPFKDVVQVQYPNWVLYFTSFIKYLNRASSPMAKIKIPDTRSDILISVPGMGLEPIRDCSHDILSVACLPFHHPGK